MSDVNATPATPEVQPGVMSSLPKTRPQRPSARRAAARRTEQRTAKARTSAAAEGVSPARPSRPKPSCKAPGKAAAEPPRAPRQGFEAQSEIETGKAVTPPSGIELAASVVELLGELAQSGLESGGRMLKDALARLPGA